MGHYSVRSDRFDSGKFIVVWVGIFGGEKGVDLPSFSSFDDAFLAAQKLQRLKEDGDGLHRL